jgi:hypothetical protein
MPHVPKSVLQPRALSSTGLTRPELVAEGAREPQAKNPIPERKPEKENTHSLGIPIIDPRTYAGSETDPDHVADILLGKDAGNDGSY